MPPPSSAGIFPLSAVHAGLHGTAYTVFEGSTPEPFGVDVLGVLHNSQGPGEDLILVRLTGAKAEHTGVVAGMSGSPVYIDGKLVGALGFRIGEFSKEPIGGITPIAQMLAVRDIDAAATPVASALASGNPQIRAVQSVQPIQQIDTPLVFTGFSPAALALWKQHAPPLGMEAVAGLGGSSQSPADAAKAPALEPGSAVSALLVSGDMEIAATCTVTYLDSAGRLLACGHPLTQFGAVSLPMTKADVLATLASQSNSFKIINTGETVGAFTEDRQTAIGGTLGITAHTIPVEITLHNPHVAADVAATRVLHLNVLDQAQVTPTAILVSLFQALQQTPSYAEEDSLRVQATVRLPGYEPVTIATLASAGSFGPAALSAALTIGQRFNALYSSGDRQTHFTSVQITVDVLPGRHTVALSRAVVEQTMVHAGDRIDLAATLAPYRGAPQSLRIPLTLPTSLPRGEVRLLISDGPTLDGLLSAGHGAGPTPLGSTVAQLNANHPDDALYVSLLSPDAEVSMEGETLGTVPLSIANLLAASHERDRAALHSESIQTLAAMPLSATFTGQQVLTLRVE